LILTYSDTENIALICVDNFDDDDFIEFAASFLGDFLFSLLSLHIFFLLDYDNFHCGWPRDDSRTNNLTTNNSITLNNLHLGFKQEGH